MSGWLQLFYRGSDSSVWTRSRNPSGNWSDEAVLGGFLTGAPVAAAIPGSSTLELFYRGGDNALWTRWCDPGTYWSDEVRMGGFLTSDPVAAAVPGTNTLQLFYRGGDDALWTRWRDDSGTWSDEVRMGGLLTSDPVAAAPIVAVSPLSWMSQLPDASRLSKLTLPGTHESCTAFLTPAASCQSWSLHDQLNHGIRYVDIRCRQIQDVFAIHHENVYVGFNFGEGVRDVCVDFLKANPTECIVMQIKHEYTDYGNNLTFQQVFDGYVQGFESFFYLDNRIPALGEVRGKIVVIRRFDVDSPDTVKGLWPDPWQDNATFDAQYTATDSETVTFHIQDQYSLSSGDINPKWSAVNALLGRASTDGTFDWYINFASASTSTGLAFPDYYAGELNPLLYDYLAGGPFDDRLGTLMLDFPDDNMIHTLIKLNT